MHDFLPSHFKKFKTRKKSILRWIYLSFFKGCLDLWLLCLHLLLGLLQFMDALTSLSNLFSQIWDFLCREMCAFQSLGSRLEHIFLKYKGNVFLTHVGGSCFHASWSPADPEPPHRSSSFWTAQCQESEPPSELPQAQPDPPRISASTLPAPE